jgi:bacillithiol system protein YtxJ
MNPPRWTKIEDIDDFLARKATGIVFKHSTRCPISHAAWQEFLAFLEVRKDVPAAAIFVVEDRPISLAFAEKTGVRHESPQALLVAGGRVAWHASHGSITRSSLEAAWAASGTRVDQAGGAAPGT